MASAATAMSAFTARSDTPTAKASMLVATACMATVPTVSTRSEGVDARGNRLHGDRAHREHAQRVGGDGLLASFAGRIAAQGPHAFAYHRCADEAQDDETHDARVGFHRFREQTAQPIAGYGHERLEDGEGDRGHPQAPTSLTAIGKGIGNGHREGVHRQRHAEHQQFDNGHAFLPSCASACCHDIRRRAAICTENRTAITQAADAFAQPHAAQRPARFCRSISREPLS